MSWEYKTLDELGTISRGRSQHRPRNDVSLLGGEYPLIQTLELKEAVLHVNKYKDTYNEAGLAQSKMWKAGTLCLTIAGNSIAENAILGFDACFPDSIMGFVPYEGVSNVLFVKYSIDLLKKECKQISQGTAQDNLSWQKLSTIKFPAPDIETQNKIANILSSYDNLIETNQRQILLLEDATQLLYKEWFVDLRFPGYESSEIVDGIPAGWREGSLANVAEFKRGKTITKAQVTDGNVPVVAGGLEPAYYHNKANTVAPVITVSGSGANAGFARLYSVDVFASDCSFIDSNTTPYLYYVYCFVKENKSSLDALQKGAAQPHVYAKDINALKMIVPTTDIIEKYCEFVSPYFEKIKSLQRIMENVQQARDRLLPKLMSGEIEV